MSRPRSRSPRYRRFPWEEPDFDPCKVLADLDRDGVDRGCYAGEDPKEHVDFLGTDMYPEDQRRYRPVSDDRPFMHQRRLNQEDFYHRRPSPCRDAMAYDDRRLSPLCDGGGSGVREHSKSIENRRRSPYSPLRLPREQLPPTPRSHSDHQRREPGMDWRREEQGRAQGRFRNASPSARTDDQGGRAGWERGRRNTLDPNRERQREDSHQERNPPSKRQRREMDDDSHLGYRNEEDFDDQRYSMDAHRDSFRGDTQESLPRGDVRHPGPLVIEHDHGIAHGREPSRWKQSDDRRGRDPVFDRQRSPRPLFSSQELFRTSESRLDPRDDGRGRRFQDNWREADSHQSRRSLMPQDRPNTMRHGNQRGKGGPRQARGRTSGRTGPQRNQPRLHESTQGYQDVPHEEQRPGYRPFREDYENPVEEEADWAEETRLQQWKRDGPESLGRRPSNIGLASKTPHQRMNEWGDQKSNYMTITTEETLTVKVDMSRPANVNSSLCYSSDRQLSLDLVNVGRQRLDFLPMLEHSGTYRETAMHTGTFAQEIITLVHHVKEQYFRDGGVTLNERFSAPQKGEGETEELTLDERFSPNRGFSFNMKSLLDDEPLFSRPGPLLPVRAPGDLRNDLERRRQERLEGVKVTISGSRMSQRPLGPLSELGPEYRDKDEMDQMEDEGFSKWPEEQSRRREGNMGPRRGASYRSNNGSLRRNNRFGNRLGPMRRQNNHHNPAGPHW